MDSATERSYRQVKIIVLPQPCRGGRHSSLYSQIPVTEWQSLQSSHTRPWRQFEVARHPMAAVIRPAWPPC
jgi:hypothetical protein